MYLIFVWEIIEKTWFFSKCFCLNYLSLCNKYDDNHPEVSFCLLSRFSSSLFFMTFSISFSFHCFFFNSQFVVFVYLSFFVVPISLSRPLLLSLSSSPSSLCFTFSPVYFDLVSLSIFVLRSPSLILSWSHLPLSRLPLSLDLISFNFFELRWLNVKGKEQKHKDKLDNNFFFIS